MFRKKRDQAADGQRPTGGHALVRFLTRRHAEGRDGGRRGGDVGFAELEGDFEAERRRAEAALHHRVQPYEHTNTDAPVIPGKSAGLTHP